MFFYIRIVMRELIIINIIFITHQLYSVIFNTNNI